MSTATQRTCREVEAGYASAGGDNERHACENGTFAALPGVPQCKTCTSCGAGLYENATCAATADRTCRPVGADKFSYEGDNEERDCFNVNCAAGTWRKGTSCDDATGEGYLCVACSSCGAGEREATPCNATADRTCRGVGEGNWSAAGDNGEQPCFNVECPDGTWRDGAGCDGATGEGYECVVCSSCGAGEYQLHDCSATANRTCQPVGAGFASAAGDNGREACVSGETFAAGERGASCELCSSCGEGEYQLSECNATANRTCQQTQPGWFSPKSDDARYPCEGGTYAARPGSSRCTESSSPTTWQMGHRASVAGAGGRSRNALRIVGGYGRHRDPSREPRSG